jgi:predicted GH43/DUF377 family glycosyl hydrolase
MTPLADRLVFTPRDVDLTRSPLRASLDAETYALGAFNPGLARLPNGNLLLMVRIAEALKEPVFDSRVHAIWRNPNGRYESIGYPLIQAEVADPRIFYLKSFHHKTAGLTSLSWLLPVETSPDGLECVAVHYDKAIAPVASYQEYGVEDPRISLIDGVYYMTACSVSAERLATCLYTSRDGLSYTPEGIVLDHQNKDMALFEGRIDGRFWAITRPLGDVYFAYPPDSDFLPGPSINLAVSPDALHWRPVEAPFIRPRKSTRMSKRIGGGSQPILTREGWLMLYHGVEAQGEVGIYSTLWALLERDNPTRILRIEDSTPLLEARPDLTEPLKELMYVPDVVFTTGIVDGGDFFIVASGEADLACRVTHIAKNVFGA